MWAEEQLESRAWDNMDNVLHSQSQSWGTHGGDGHCPKGDTA